MNRSPTIIAAIFFLSLIFGIFLTWPKYKEYKSKEAEVYQKEAEFRNMKDYYAQIASLSGELGKYSAEMEKIDTALPSKFSLFSFFNYLQKITSENGLILTGYNYSSSASKSGAKQTDEGQKAIPGEMAGETGAETTENKIEELTFDMNLSGPYSSFLNLLSTLERSSKLIEIEKISFSALDDPEKPWTFNLGIKVSTY